VLEFSKPRHWLIRRPYLFFFRRVLPAIGQVLFAQPGQRPIATCPKSVMQFPRIRGGWRPGCARHGPGRCDVSPVHRWDCDALRRPKSPDAALACRHETGYCTSLGPTRLHLRLRRNPACPPTSRPAAESLPGVSRFTPPERRRKKSVVLCGCCCSCCCCCCLHSLGGALGSVLVKLRILTCRIGCH